ncbi:phosphotransferase [Caldibacillus lycopersici]|uniref:Phosphotransferase n=1 Tax=Perspicuibacillus lycopersici TaxID=1325689 RepID=A0AAE3IWP3_9BACI|nr:aminoglycoside phosphotransferase family protein [Perspicuibacillus lycopersici]MCU9614779.1 phosphotransferase [Perspicuibacillus lycopersici]
MISENVIGVGNTAHVISFKENFVAKIFHAHIPQDAFTRELTISKKVLESGLPVPKVYGDQNLDGRNAIIYERIIGVPLTKLILENAWMANKQMKTLAKLHAEIHSKTGLELPAQKQSLIKKIKKAETLTANEKKKIIHELNILPKGNVLCHGDFHPDNVLISNEGPYIIDWIDATIGNQMADVVRTMLILRYGGFNQNISPIQYKLQKIYRYYLSQSYMKAYHQLLPFAKELIDKWMLPVAAARLTENIPALEKKELHTLIQQRLAKI